MSAVTPLVVIVTPSINAQGMRASSARGTQS